jgi:hypothetical protein
VLIRICKRKKIFSCFVFHVSIFRGCRSLSKRKHNIYARPSSICSYATHYLVMASAPMWSSLEAKSSSHYAYCRTTWGLFGRLHSNLWTQRWFRCWATLNIVVRQQLSKAILHGSCHLSHHCSFKHTKQKNSQKRHDPFATPQCCQKVLHNHVQEFKEIV